MKKLLLFVVLTVLCLSCSKGAPDAPHLGALASPGQVGPFVFPTSWLQATWFVDPANTSTCASDNNRTCSLGTCGTSGDGPCLTYGSVASRWGTTAPYLNQNTVLTWMSNEPSATVDQVVFNPQIGESGFAWINTTLTVGSPGTITVVAGKVIASNQPLQASFSSGAPTQGVMAHNTTHASRAWVDSVTSTINANVGPLITQPFVLAQTPPTFPVAFTSQVDTWATGNAFVFETPKQVNLRVVKPTFVAAQSGVFQAGVGVAIQQVWVPSPTGAADGASIFQTNGQVIIQESRIDLQEAQAGSTVGNGRALTWDNNWWSTGGEFTEIFPVGGALATLHNTSANSALGFDGNAIVHGIWSLARSPFLGQIGAVYSDGDLRAVNGRISITNAFSYGSGIYGTANVRAEFGGGFDYPAGAASGVAAFNGSTIFLGFNNTKACLGNPAQVATTLTCNISLTGPSVLDSQLGTTVPNGCLYEPGQGAYCNGN